MLLSQMVLLGFSSGNSLACGRYVLLASGSSEGDGWRARGIPIPCITFAVVLHSTLPKWDIRLFNVPGIFKVVILLFIAFAGFAALAGQRNFPDPQNFDNAFRLGQVMGTVEEELMPTRLRSFVSSIATKGKHHLPALGAFDAFIVLFMLMRPLPSWENANYVLGEIKNARRTLKVAVPLAVGGVTIFQPYRNQT